MPSYPSMTCGEAETDQILVPVATGYQVYPLTQIFGWGNRTLRAWQGMGLSPLHFITQRGPLQDGESVIDMRFDPRTIQIVIAETLMDRTTFWDRKWDWFDLLRPNRSFDGTVKPLIYRKWLPHGKMERGTDLVTTNGSSAVTSNIGRFVERGLETGAEFHIETGADAGTYVVASVPNDYTVLLDTAMGATATNVHWRYARGRGVRDLYCLLAQGPAFDQGPGPMVTYPTGYREALRFIAHDPFWYGVEQSETWAIAGALGDLVFDGLGAWAGATAGSGRWLFAPTFVGRTIQVIYWGTAAAKPIITITGPAHDPAVENTTIGTRIEMNYTVALGETVTIDTLALTVQNQAGTNLLPYTTGDIATFQLSPAPQAPNRNNEVYVSFSSGLSGTSAAEMTWQNRHVGLA
jgi:hypothetical protein